MEKIKILLEELWVYFDEKEDPTEQELYYIAKLNELLNKKDPSVDYTQKTLGEFLSSSDQNVKRHAIGILKELQK